MRIVPGQIGIDQMLGDNLRIIRPRAGRRQNPPDEAAQGIGL